MLCEGLVVVKVEFEGHALADRSAKEELVEASPYGKAKTTRAPETISSTTFRGRPNIRKLSNSGEIW